MDCSCFVVIVFLEFETVNQKYICFCHIGLSLVLCQNLLQIIIVCMCACLKSITQWIENYIALIILQQIFVVITLKPWSTNCHIWIPENCVITSFSPQRFNWFQDATIQCLWAGSCLTMASNFHTCWFYSFLFLSICIAVYFTVNDLFQFLLYSE